MIKIRASVILFLACCSIYAIAGIQREGSVPGKVFAISIGIDRYSAEGYLTENCVKDATALADKLIHDCPRRTYSEILKHDSSRYDANLGWQKWFLVDTVICILLKDDNATLENIRKAFQHVILEARPYDHFIFYFGGISIERPGTNETFLVPFLDKGFDRQNIQFDKLVSLDELAKFMEQVQCKNQLILSEAGYGNSFAQNLISSLFEANPLIAAGELRNRIIITTKGFGYDDLKCPSFPLGGHGPLMTYILANENLLNAFTDLPAYELSLVRTEVECPAFGKKYFSIYEEEKYRQFILSNYQKMNSRGAQILQPEELNEPEGPGKVYALLIASNLYEDGSAWNNLKNPCKDAEAVAYLLESKYKVQVIKVFNQPKDSVLLNLIKIKKTMGEQDKLIFFIAGHGYFDGNYSDGFIVFTDSRNPINDPSLDSYLQMASLQRLLDNVKAKNVFAIFDICFGASFDLQARDEEVDDYRDLERDISLDEFIKRKDEYTSRIFLASGRYEVPDYWKDSQSHSPFADKLIKALQEEDEFISPGKIYRKMEGNITEPFLKYFGRHDTRGDFLIKVE